MTGPDEPVPVQADAQSVVDWYRRQLAEMTHRAAFAESSLALERRHAAGLRTELGQISADLGVLQEAVAQSSAKSHWLLPDHPDFPAWVAQHWDAIVDAHLAHAVEQSDRPAPAEQP